MMGCEGPDGSAPSLGMDSDPGPFLGRGWTGPKSDQKSIVALKRTKRGIRMLVGRR
jgi:hypothetical protein